MKTLFKSKWTKWIPLGNYVHVHTNYIAFVRKNLKTGMMQFKVKKVHAWVQWHYPFIPKDLIDVKAAWETIINQETP